MSKIGKRKVASEVDEIPVKKKKKSKNKNGCSSAEHVSHQEPSVTPTVCHIVKKKKKKKSRLESNSNCVNLSASGKDVVAATKCIIVQDSNQAQNIDGTSECSATKLKGKKKAKKKNNKTKIENIAKSCNVDADQNNEASPAIQIDEPKNLLTDKEDKTNTAFKKKKKKKHSNNIESSGFGSEETTVAKEDNADRVDDIKSVLKTKKKKSKKIKDKTNTLANVPDENLTTRHNNVKEKNEPTANALAMQHVKKKKKKKRNAETITSDASSVKTEVKIFTDSSSNGKTQPKAEEKHEAKPNEAANFQLSSRAFVDEQRQQKFLRLLGGAKKINFVSSSAGGGGGASQVKVLSHDDGSKLNEALERQFVSATRFNLQRRHEGNRSAGLGFRADPAAGKKFHIDANKTNSVKFDD